MCSSNNTPKIIHISTKGLELPPPSPPEVSPLQGEHPGTLTWSVADTCKDEKKFVLSLHQRLNTGTNKDPAPLLHPLPNDPWSQVVV